MVNGSLTLDGRRYVLVPEDEYARLTGGTPQLPPADAAGNRPAVAFARATIGRSIVRDRERVGMTGAELATAAGIAVDALTRAERGASVPSGRTLEKIEAALVAAGLRRETPAARSDPAGPKARGRPTPAVRASSRKRSR